MRPATKYCIDLTRKGDYHHYLCNLFSQQPARDAMWAIRAFNIETSSIQEVTTQDTIAKMRFEFWKDLVDRSFDLKPFEHPVSQQLSHVLSSGDIQLSKSWFKRILRERKDHLTRTTFPTIDALEKYAEHTASSLLYLHLEALGIRQDAADVI